MASRPQKSRIGRSANNDIHGARQVHYKEHWGRNGSDENESVPKESNIDHRNGCVFQRAGGRTSATGFQSGRAFGLSSLMVRNG